MDTNQSKCLYIALHILGNRNAEPWEYIQEEIYKIYKASKLSGGKSQDLFQVWLTALELFIADECDKYDIESWEIDPAYDAWTKGYYRESIVTIEESDFPWGEA